MGKRRRMNDEDRLQSWWERAWKEREDLFRDRFGETDPPGWVMSFSWNDFSLTIPGACALTFPPDSSDRTHWLTLGHGLTQPSGPEPTVPGRWSGYGCEFALLTHERQPWAAEVLYQLMTYLKSAGATIGIGHRVPIAFFDRGSEGLIQPKLGMVREDDPDSPIGNTRALVFSRFSAQSKPLWTKTGYFDILIGTTITAGEWSMAKETSSAHLLYLLSLAGIGQVSDLERSIVTDDPRWSEEWQAIRRLATEDVEKLITEL